MCQVRKPASYRAPSWSWASLESHIKFVPLDFKNAVAEFVHCSIEPAGLDVYGKVKSGLMQLRVKSTEMSLLLAIANIEKAPVVEVLPNNPQDKLQPADEHLVLGQLVQVKLSHGVSKGEAYFDFAPVFPCFAIFLDSQYCLLATSTNDKDFERVGMGRFMRTAHQRKMEPLLTLEPLKWNDVGWGPIGKDVEKKLVIIR